MKLTFNVKVSVQRGSLVEKATGVAARAFKIANEPIRQLVIERGVAAAEKKFKTMAPRYKRELNKPGVVQVDPSGMTIKITDPVVVALERGMKAFDMKSKLLAKGKTGKDGSRYIDIPFEHKASSIPTAARQKLREASLSAGGAPARLAQKTIGRAFTRQLQRAPSGQAVLRPPRRQGVWHKRGAHDDLVRKSSARGGASYSTIRRISSRSAQSAWWHPGFKAARIIDGVLPSVRGEVVAIVRQAFSTARSGS